MRNHTKSQVHSGYSKTGHIRANIIIASYSVGSSVLRLDVGGYHRQGSSGWALHVLHLGFDIPTVVHIHFNALLICSLIAAQP